MKKMRPQTSDGELSNERVIEVQTKVLACLRRDWPSEDDADLEDATATTLMDLLEKLRRGPIENPVAWAILAAKRRVIDCRRKKNCEQRLLLGVGTPRRRAGNATGRVVSLQELEAAVSEYCAGIFLQYAGQDWTAELRRALTVGAEGTKAGYIPADTDEQKLEARKRLADLKPRRRALRTWLINMIDFPESHRMRNDGQLPLRRLKTNREMVAVIRLCGLGLEQIVRPGISRESLVRELMRREVQQVNRERLNHGWGKRLKFFIN